VDTEARTGKEAITQSGIIKTFSRLHIIGSAIYHRVEISLVLEQVGMNMYEELTRIT
jgi:hypothetical protein